MSRIIKASEVKPGMVVKWESNGFTHEGTVERVTSGASAYTTRFINGSFSMTVTSDTTVTVVSEPQPEEPKEFGAKVIVDGRQFLRAPLHSSDPTPWLSQLDNIWRDWDYLINMGPVTVVPDLGWTVPADTPEVPDRIEVWPEDDTSLRNHKWVDGEGDIWQCVDGIWQWGEGPWGDHDTPLHGPWERKTDA